MPLKRPLNLAQNIKIPPHPPPLPLGERGRVRGGSIL